MVAVAWSMSSGCDRASIEALVAEKGALQAENLAKTEAAAEAAAAEQEGLRGAEKGGVRP